MKRLAIVFVLTIFVLVFSCRTGYTRQNFLINKGGGGLAETKTAKGRTVSETNGKDIEDARDYAPGHLIIKIKLPLTDKCLSDKERFKEEARQARLSAKSIKELIGAKSYKILIPDVEQMILKSHNKSKNKSLDSHGISRIFILEVNENEDLAGLINTLRKDPRIEYCEKDYILEPAAVPADPYYDKQWQHNRIESEAAWDIETGSPTITIAVIDSQGFDLAHEDLIDNYWINGDEIPDNGIDDDVNGYIDDVGGWNFSQNNNNPSYSDTHGTKCAGMIAAVGDNGKGICGVSWKSKIMPLMAYMSSQEAKAIIYAANNGARVINCSYCLYTPSKLTHDAIKTVTSEPYNMTVVASAGNDDSRKDAYPADYPEVIKVASSDINDELASSSNYGPGIDIAAPGVNVYTTTLTSSGKYDSFSGTSAAAPNAAGLVALLLSQNPDYTYREVRKALQMSADDISTPYWDICSGYGRINASRALSLPRISPGCTAIIRSPENNEVLDGLLTIKGTAEGHNFYEYKLYCSNLETLKENNWTPIEERYPGEHKKPVLDGELGAMDLSSLIEGDYILRLVVTNSAMEEYTFHRIFTIDRAYIKNIKENDFFRLGDIISIEGTVEKWPGYSGFQISYSRVEDPDNWHQEGITQFAEGHLADWDSSRIPFNEAEYYYLRLTVNGHEADRKMIYLDPALRSNWPKVFEWDLNPDYYWDQPYRFNIVTADINNDGKKEIIFPIGMSYTTTRIFAIDADGNEVWQIVLPAGRCHDLAVGDVDNDGYMEVVALVWHGITYLYILEHNGTVKDGFPKKINHPFEPNAPVLADVNMDGQLEIIAKTKAFNGIAHFHIFNLESLEMGGEEARELFPAWPIEVKASLTLCNYGHTPAVGNLDEDGDLEMIFVTPLEEESGTKAVVYALNYDGSEHFRQALDGDIASTAASPSIGDIDNDGSNEVIISCWSDIYVLSHDGRILWSRPRNIGHGLVALTDFDNNGYLELVSNENYGDIYIYKHNGELMKRFWMTDHLSSWLMSPVVGDVTGDGVLDVITIEENSWNFENILRVSDFFGNPVPALYKKFQKSNNIKVAKATPVMIDDLDCDGKIEIIAANIEDWYFGTRQSKSSSSIYVWSLDAAYDTQTMHWPMIYHDKERTGFYPKKGDINWDADVDALDLQCCVNIILDLPHACGKESTQRADLDINGIVDIFDLQKIIKIIFNTQDTFSLP